MQELGDVLLRGALRPERLADNVRVQYCKLTLGVFNCWENNVAMYLVVSDLAVLLLAPEDKRRNFCALRLWATFYSLAKLERDTDTPSKLVFHWQQKGKAVMLEATSRNSCGKN